MTRDLPNDLFPFMDRVAVGPRGSRDLTYDEAYRAMTAILRGRFHPATLGAFLLALRWKGEAPEELAGFLDAMRDDAGLPYAPAAAGTRTAGHVPPLDPGRVLDVAGNYDGKNRTLHVSVAASLLAAAAGVPLLLHDGVGIPTKYGTTKAHVLEALGVPVDVSLEEAWNCLETVGIAFVPQARFNPGLHRLLPVRRELGKRPFFNVIEPLANPFGARVHVGSFFHVNYGEKVCRALAVSKAGFDRAVIVQGIEGSDEVRLGRARIAELRDGEIEIYYLDSASLGLSGTMDDLASPGSDPRASARHTLALLEGEEVPQGFRDAALLNAALRLYAAGRVDSWAAGVDLAKETLASGKALDLLARWREWKGANALTSNAPVPPREQPDYATRTGWKGPMSTYPVFLVGLGERRCLVVGGGPLAADKVRGLLAAGAGRVDVVSPRLSADMMPWVDGVRVRHIPRAFAADDVEGAHLVIAATDDPQVNRCVYEAATARGVLVNVVDDPPHCTFILPSVVRRGALTVAISTGGASPALAARLRERLEQELGREYERFIELAAEVRPRIMDGVADPELRRRLWYQIVDSPVLELLREGREAEARRHVEQLIAHAIGRERILHATS